MHSILWFKSINRFLLILEHFLQNFLRIHTSTNPKLVKLMVSSSENDVWSDGKLKSYWSYKSVEPNCFYMLKVGLWHVSSCYVCRILLQLWQVWPHPEGLPRVPILWQDLLQVWQGRPHCPWLPWCRRLQHGQQELLQLRWKWSHFQGLPIILWRWWRWRQEGRVLQVGGGYFFF